MSAVDGLAADILFRTTSLLDKQPDEIVVGCLRTADCDHHHTQIQYKDVCSNCGKEIHYSESIRKQISEEYGDMSKAKFVCNRCLDEVGPISTHLFKGPSPQALEEIRKLTGRPDLTAEEVRRMMGDHIAKTGGRMNPIAINVFTSRCEQYSR